MRKAALYVLWVFVATIPFDRLNLEALVGAGSAATLTRLVGIAAFAIGVVLTLYKGRLRRLHTAHVVAYAFVGWAVLSVLWSFYPIQTLLRAVTYVQLSMMVWLIAQFAQERTEQDSLMVAYLAGCLVVGGALIGGKLAGVTGIELFPGRFTSFGYNPNDLALTMAIGIPFAWRLFLTRDGAIGWLGFIFFPIAVLSALLAASRGGMLSIVVASLVIPVTFFRLGGVKRSSLIAMTVLAVGAAIYIVPEESFERLMTIDDVGQTQISVEGLRNLSGSDNIRLSVWEAGITTFWENPYFGIGAGAYADVVAPISGDSYVAHNIFVSVLVELGGIGLLLFLGMIVYLAFATRFMDRNERTIWLVLLLTYAVGGFFLSWEHTKQTWLLVGLLAARAAYFKPVVTERGKATQLPAEVAELVRQQKQLELTRQEEHAGDGYANPGTEPTVVPHVVSPVEELGNPAIYDRRRRLVVEILSDSTLTLGKDPSVSDFYEALAERDETWVRGKSARDYFRRKLKLEYPKTLSGWSDIATQWAQELPPEEE